MPPFAPKALEDELLSVWSAVTNPAVQVAPHHSHVGVQVIELPATTGVVKLEWRRYQPPPAMK
jgi:hypothetical protein